MKKCDIKGCENMCDDKFNWCVRCHKVKKSVFNTKVDNSKYHKRIRGLK